MPPLVAAVAAALVVEATILTLGVFAYVLGAVVYAGINYAIAGRPKSNTGSNARGSQAAAGRTVTVREPAAPWQIIYGQCRVGGVLTFVEESQDKQDLHLIVTFAGHVVEEITDIWVADEIVALDEDGWVAGSPTSNEGHTKYIGPAGRPYLRVLKSTGDEIGQPFPDLQSESNGKWTSVHLQYGRAKIWCKLIASASTAVNIWPSGVPNFTAVIKGKKVYDPRIPDIVWSANPALCLADYLTDTNYGMGLPWAEIDLDDLIAAADVCDEQVEVVGVSPTEWENRYECNGAISSSTAPKDIISQLTIAMAGSAVNIGGIWHIFAGQYTAPTVNLTEDELAGGFTIRTQTSRKDNANAIRGIFLDPNNQWQVADFPSYYSATYVAQDDGEVVWKDIDLSQFVTSASQAQRLAKIELLRTRQGLQVQANFKLSAFRAVTGSTVTLTVAHCGWDAKEFTVLGSSFSVTNDGHLGVTLTLQETTSLIYDWSTVEGSAYDLAANTNLPSPFTVAPPGAPTVAEELYETRDGRGLAIKARVTASVSDAATVSFQFRWKLNSSSVWIEAAPTYATDNSATLEIFDLGRYVYDFAARAINVFGISSEWSVTTTQEITGLGTEPPPPNVTGAQLSSGSIILTLSYPSEHDVQIGGRIFVRHTEETADPQWNESFSIGDRDGYPGNSTVLILPLKQGTYLLKTVDSTGLASLTWTEISTKQSFLFQLNSAGSITEHSTFAGVHNDTVVVSGTLQLAENSGDDVVMTSGTYEFASSFDFGAVTRVRLTSEIQGVGVAIFDTIDARTELIDTWPDFDGAVSGNIVDAWVELRETDDNPAGSPTWSVWKRLDSSDVEAWGVELRAQLITTDGAYNVIVDTLAVHAKEIP